jgi:hypothetical protein
MSSTASAPLDAQFAVDILSLCIGESTSPAGRSAMSLQASAY